MFRKMLRKRQLMGEEEVIEIMTRLTNGVLSCTGDQGYPYGVPVSYVFYKNKIYFHTAKKGHLPEALLRNPKVSFTVVDKDIIVSEEYTSYFSSVIIFGRARVCQGEEYLEGFRALVEKFSGDQTEENKEKEIRECRDCYIMAVDIEHMTGKKAIELVR